MKTSNKILLGGLAAVTFVFLVFTIMARVNIVPVEEIKGSGVDVMVTREVSSFKELRVQTQNVKVITRNGPPSCTIEGDEEIVPLIVTEQDGEDFFIKNDKNKPFRFRKPVTITLTNDNWESFIINGSDLTTMDTIETEYFNLESNGAGNFVVKVKAQKVKTLFRGASDLDLYGEAENSDISVFGAGTVRAYDFTTQNADVDLTGAANAYVYVEKFLNARASGAAEVIYRGNPEVRKSTSGAASVRRGGSE